MGTKNNPGKFDCYANADPDEPMFVLLGRDKHAPTLVWLWSVLREFDQEKPEIVAQSRQCVIDMMKWAHEHGRKIVGLGEAGLAAMLELIRMANSSAAAKDATNEKTDVETLRQFLSTTTFEQEKST